MPKVSVVVPIYNAEKYLQDCLESIIYQTLQDIEIICVNDGSKDNSLSIIQEYALKDKRIKIIDKPNTGYGHSMNKGIEQATGEYIGIVESDDFVAREMFEKLYHAADKNLAEVVKCNYLEHRNNSSIFIENLKGCKYKNIFSPLKEQSVFFVTPSIWSGIYKRSFLANNNIRFNETPGASYQDTAFAFKVWASAERAYLVNDAFLHYRKDNMDSSVNSSSKIFCVCDEYEEIEKFLDSHIYKKNKLASLTFAMKFRTYKWNYNRLISPFQYTFLLKMAEEFKRDENEGLISKDYLNALELNEVHTIIHNTDKYFKDTAKDYGDDRLSLNSALELTLNLQFYKKGLLDCIAKYNNVIIFGAGVIGKRVAQNLIDKENVKNILCFAVSNSSENLKSVIGIPVHCVHNLGGYTEDSVILVATKERDQYDIIKMLKSLNFRNIVSIDSSLLNILGTEEL